MLVKSYCCVTRTLVWSNLQAKKLSGTFLSRRLSSPPLDRDVTLDYNVYNENNVNSSEDPLVILHGVFGGKKNWQSLCKRINQITGRTVYAFDAVNHGNSSHHPSMSYEDMAYDLVKFTEKMKIKSSILVGHSMGGKTVMTTSLLYPEIVSRLVVVDMVFKSTPSTGEVLTYLRLLNDMDLTKIFSKKEADQYLAQHIESTSLRQFLLTNLDTTRGLLRWRCNLKAMISNYPHIHGTPVIDENITYDRPTLFIGGARSYYIREKDYPEIKARFPNSEIRHIAGAGHWVHSEKPKQFTGILTEFVMK